MPASDLRRHFCLEPGLTFLNHGSFGACPRRVLEHQARLRERLEASPVQFMLSLPQQLEAARHAVAPFLGAAPDDIAFVRNATEGVNAVLRSLVFAPGDEILTTNHVYAACLNALRFVAERSAVSVRCVEVPFPVQSSAQIVEALRAAVTERTRLALIDHVTSPTALVFPVAAIARVLRERGVRVLVDGAHASGMLELDIEALGVDYYATNLHKWVCAPKGAAVLWVRRELQGGVYPTVMSHGYSEPPERRFRAMFDWTGTGDPTPWLCVPKAIEVMGQLCEGGWSELRARNRELARRAREVLCALLHVDPPAPDALLGSMASLPLPKAKLTAAPALDAPRAPDPLYVELCRRRFEVPVFPWPNFSERLVRVSAQIYNGLDEYERLGHALVELL